MNDSTFNVASFLQFFSPDSFTHTRTRFSFLYLQASKDKEGYKNTIPEEQSDAENGRTLIYLQTSVFPQGNVSL